MEEDINAESQPKCANPENGFKTTLYYESKSIRFQVQKIKGNTHCFKFNKENLVILKSFNDTWNLLYPLKEVGDKS